MALSYATAYYGLESDPALFETAVRALAEGNAIRATGRIVQIDKNTVCDWLDRAALHCRSIALYFWGHLHVTECQLDELWGFVHTKEAHLPCAKLSCETYGDAWSGELLHQCGASCWHSWLGNALRRTPIGFWIG